MNNELFIADSALDFRPTKSFFKLNNFIEDVDLHLKLEGFNPSGSIKIKAAVGMIEALESSQNLQPGKHTIIESSSGNLGVALSLVAKIKGYKFICVSDPNINEVTRQYIHLYGGKVLIIDKRDKNGGYLASRIEFIKELIKNDQNLIWLNQYASIDNLMSHYHQTAEEIFSSFKKIDYLFVGVGTSGTIMGCSKYIRDNKLPTKLIGVDPEGSVTFGFPAKKRLIPGIGTSRKPELLNEKLIDDVVLVPEVKTIRMCREILNKHSLLIGGSTGSVLSGIIHYKEKIFSGACVAAISPDFGDKYLNTIYNDIWVNENFPGLLSTLSFK